MNHHEFEQFTSNQEQETIIEASGFVHGGLNDPELIRGLEQVNDIPVDRLEMYMRKPEQTEYRFLGLKESLLDVMADNNDVVAQMNLNHSDFADPIVALQEMRLDGALIGHDGHGSGTPAEIVISGHDYLVTYETSRGVSFSPFDDAYEKTDDAVERYKKFNNPYDYKVVNPRTGAGVILAEHHIQMIGEFGFYGGGNRGYRLSPERIAQTFTHLGEHAAAAAPDLISTIPEDDPVVEAIAAGEIPEGAELTTFDQVARLSNAKKVGLIDTVAAVVFKPQTVEDLVKYLEIPKDIPLSVHKGVSINVDNIYGLDPVEIEAESYSNLDEMMNYTDVSKDAERSGFEPTPITSFISKFVLNYADSDGEKIADMQEVLRDEWVVEKGSDKYEEILAKVA